MKTGFSDKRRSTASKRRKRERGAEATGLVATLHCRGVVERNPWSRQGLVWIVGLSARQARTCRERRTVRSRDPEWSRFRIRAAASAGAADRGRRRGAQV